MGPLSPEHRDGKQLDLRKKLAIVRDSKKRAIPRLLPIPGTSMFRRTDHELSWTCQVTRVMLIGINPE